MRNFDDFDLSVVARTKSRKNSYIRSVETLVPLTQKFAADFNLDILEDKDAEKLKLGYYPDKSSFESYVTHSFYNKLPNAHGLVFPYVREGVVTMLTINEMESENDLSPYGRTYLYGDGQHYFNKQGIFGGHRLQGKGRREIVLTDNELLVCQIPNAIAIQELCDFSLHLLHARTNHVVLSSTNRTWLMGMIKLSKLGFDISVDSDHVLEYVAREIIELTKAGLTPAKLARQAARYLRCLTTIEQNAIISTVLKFTGVVVTAVPSDADHPEYISENAYFKDVQATLLSKLASLTMGKDVLHLKTLNGDAYKLLIQPSAVAAVVCPLFDVSEDLVQWSYNQFNGLPRSIKDAGSSRWAHNIAIAELVLTILTRNASPESS